MTTHNNSFIYKNPVASAWKSTATFPADVLSFHKSLPSYGSTPLVPFPDLAKELGLGAVFIKDEGSRFGLPAFKILGASWAIHKALAKATGLPPNSSYQEVGAAAKEKGLSLVACSEGNWGRAVARMSKHFGIKARIYVPHNCYPATIQNIASEGVDVPVVDGNYDASIAAARDDSEKSGAILVMDTSWPGFEEIPSWVVQGYSTMLAEVDEQIRQFTQKPVTHAFASVGVGSWAHAVTAHYKSKDPSATVVTVEPDTAACLKTSLEKGEIVTIQTGDTIMAGMNCGTASLIAWPTLKEGVDAAVTITDVESHLAVEYLHEHGVRAGPCGAAPLVALRKLCVAEELRFGPDSVVVLFSTEGARKYPIPATLSMRSICFSSRLKLTRLVNQGLESSDLALFHRLWTNADATKWSIHGVCKSLKDSQKFMYKLLPQANGVGFAVHRPGIASKANAKHLLKETRIDWEFIGIITLLPQQSVLPMPLVSEYLDSSQSAPSVKAREPADVETVQLGYLFLPDYWGKGYATESVAAVLSHYRDFKASICDPKPTYIESVMHNANIGSIRVMEKLEFPVVGIKVWGLEPVMLGGELRENKTNVYGKYL